MQIIARHQTHHKKQKYKSPAEIVSNVSKDWDGFKEEIVRSCKKEVNSRDEVNVDSFMLVKETSPVFLNLTLV